MTETMTETATAKSCTTKKKQRHTGLWFLVIILLFLLMIYIAVNTGSLNVSMSQLFRGLFVAYDPDVATVWDLRFPRIFIASLGGAAVSCLLYTSRCV